MSDTLSRSQVYSPSSRPVAPDYSDEDVKKADVRQMTRCQGTSARLLLQR